MPPERPKPKQPETAPRRTKRPPKRFKLRVGGMSSDFVLRAAPGCLCSARPRTNRAPSWWPSRAHKHAPALAGRGQAQETLLLP
eukprot:634488-Pyramimonas_sp.AAC.1